MTQIDVIVSGVLCLDILPQMEHITLNGIVSPGKLLEIGTLTISTGGAVSNTGIVLHKLGAQVRLMAHLGDDFIGQQTLRLLQAHDPALTELITVLPGHSSSYTIVLAPAQVDRIFLHNTGTNALFNASSIQYEMLSASRLFHLGYPPTLPRLYEREGEELEQLLRQAKMSGVITSLDMTLPDPDSASGRANWLSILRKSLRYVDIFVPSLEEAVFMLRRDDYDRCRGEVHQHVNRSYLNAMAHELLEMGVAVAGFKLGAMGIYLRTASTERLTPLNTIGVRIEDWADAIVYHPAFRVTVAGTTGAGDATYAGLLTALVQGYSPNQTAEFACAVGACAVEAIDATSGIQNSEVIRTRIKNGWQASDLHLPP